MIAAATSRFHKLLAEEAKKQYSKVNGLCKIFEAMLTDEPTENLSLCQKVRDAQQSFDEINEMATKLGFLKSTTATKRGKTAAASTAAVAAS